MFRRENDLIVACFVTLMAGLGSLSACNERSEPFVERVAECFSYSGREGDPCPRGCAQVRSVLAFEFGADGTCDPMSLTQAPFCAPGRTADFEPINDSWYPMQRLDLAADPEGKVLLDPEEVLIINSPEDPPGWRNCPIGTSSDLCQCAIQLINDGV
jgi:hypothetical protein